MSVYHNPKALHPIPIEFFEGFSGRHWIANDVYDNLLRDFSPYSSLTVLYSTTGHEDRLDRLDRVLRVEAEEKAQELAAVMHGETEFLAWRERFVG